VSLAGPIPSQDLAPPRLRLSAHRLGAPALLVGALASIAILATRTDRLLYIHVPAAIDTFIACGAVFFAAILYLITRRPSWDRIAAVSALTALLFCSAVLISGMFWARQAWGRWWAWSPRLTFSFILWLLYAGYFALRAAVPARRRAAFCAVYGTIAFLDVPLVWLSVKLLPDIHPESVQSGGGSGLLLLAWSGALAALATAACILALGRHPAPDQNGRKEPQFPGRPR
jgi:cytochrome c biogenesis factor